MILHTLSVVCELVRILVRIFQKSKAASYACVSLLRVSVTPLEQGSANISLFPHQMCYLYPFIFNTRAWPVSHKCLVFTVYLQTCCTEAVPCFILWFSACQKWSICFRFFIQLFNCKLL